MKTKESRGEGRASAPVHRLINQHLSFSIRYNRKGPWRWRCCYSVVPETKRQLFSQLHAHWFLEGSLAWFVGTDGGLLATSVFYRKQGVSSIRDRHRVWHRCCLPFPRIYKQKRCLLLCHRDKRKRYPAVFKALSREKSDTCFWYKTPTMHLPSTNRQRGFQRQKIVCRCCLF